MSEEPVREVSEGTSKPRKPNRGDRTHLPTTDAQWTLLFQCERAPQGIIRLVGPTYTTALRLVAKSLLEYVDVTEFKGKKRTTVRLTSGGKSALDAIRCASCGHYEYHCLASGCNHADDNSHFDCDCDEFVGNTEKDQ